MLAQVHAAEATNKILRMKRIQRPDLGDAEATWYNIIFIASDLWEAFLQFTPEETEDTPVEACSLHNDLPCWSAACQQSCSSVCVPLAFCPLARAESACSMCVRICVAVL